MPKTTTDYPRQIYRHLDRGEIAQANRLFEKHLQRDQVKYWDICVDVLIATRKFQQAKELISDASDQFVDNLPLPAFAMHRAYIARVKCDYAAAADFCRVALQLSELPWSIKPPTSTHVILGSCLARQGLLDDAREQHHKAADCHENGEDLLDEIWTNIGFVHRAQGDMQQACEAFEQAIRFGGGEECEHYLADAQGALLLARDFCASEDTQTDLEDLKYDEQYAQALVVARCSAADNPNSLSHISAYAELLILLRRFSDAEEQIGAMSSPGVLKSQHEILEPFLDIFGEDAAPDRKKRLSAAWQVMMEIRESRAKLAMTRGDLPTAIEEYKHLIAEHPVQSSFLLELGRCHRLREESDTALRVFEQADALNSLQPERRSGSDLAEIGHLKRDQGQYQEAASWYAKARECWPDEPDFIRWQEDAEAAARL